MRRDSSRPVSDRGAKLAKAIAAKRVTEVVLRLRKRERRDRPEDAGTQG